MIVVCCHIINSQVEQSLNKNSDINNNSDRKNIWKKDTSLSSFKIHFHSFVVVWFLWEPSFVAHHLQILLLLIMVSLVFLESQVVYFLVWCRVETILYVSATGMSRWCVSYCLIKTDCMYCVLWIFLRFIHTELSASALILGIGLRPTLWNNWKASIPFLSVNNASGADAWCE